jgi:hypothetical protein
MSESLLTLRSVPCFAYDLLGQYDCVIQTSLMSLLNIDLNASSFALKQAVLPVSAGGLGIGQATDLALPAFLSSFTGANSLVRTLLPICLQNVSGVCAVYCTAQDNWTAVTECDFIPDRALQTAWDEPEYKLKAARLLSVAPSQSDKADRLIAVSAPHAGDFLKALPCSPLSTRLDNASLRVAVALRLGLPVSSRYTCVCNATADVFRAHALVCRKSSGHRLRHNAVNDLMKRALASADIPARLEPACLSRDDGKRLTVSR